MFEEVLFFLCCTKLEKEDFLENVHVLSCFVQLKSVVLICCVQNSVSLLETNGAVEKNTRRRENAEQTQGQFDSYVKCPQNVLKP